jgi:signal-transduction protein with cAMP-binding, CBS, and nucleotidyltransferase domain
MPRSLDVKNYSDPLYTYVHRYTQLRKEELNQVLPFLEIRLFEKKEMILEAGQIENYLNIVVKGMARKYIVQGDKKREITLQLATEGHFIHSEISFSTRMPSELCVQAVEQTILIRIENNNADRVLRNFHWAETVGRLLTVHLVASKERRLYDLRMKSPKQRLQEMAVHQPNFLRRVPQNILATWLNIKPETLSRLKKTLREKSV